VIFVVTRKASVSLLFDFLSESSGFSLSSESDPVLTFKIIEAHSAKEISIPREKPAIVIRKAVHIQDSGYKEMATMGSLMTFLIALGIFLYWLVHFELYFRKIVS